MPKITKSIVDNAPLPEKGDTWIWDTDLPGFGLRIQSSGRKTYVVRYRTKDANRTQRKVTICRAADATPDKARTLARDIFLSVAAGHDPAKERQKSKSDAGPTIEDMFKARIAYMRARNLTYTNEVERILLLAEHNAADSIGRGRAPNDVTPDDIVKFVTIFYKKGHRNAADKARGYLSTTFAWAIKSAHDYTVAERQDWGLTRNPAADVAKDHGAKKARDRNLDAAEIRVLWDACKNGEFSENTAGCLVTLIGHGQRVMETLRIEGHELDLDNALWTMPAPKTKGRKRQHKVPISRHVIPFFKALKEKHGDGPLFPRSSDDLGAQNVAHEVLSWLRSKGNTMKPFQPRDLRRTWKSRGGDGAGIDRFTRDLIQQHAKGDVASINYDWANYLPQMRAAMEKWDAWLDHVLSGEPAPSLTPDPKAPVESQTPALRLVA